MSDVPKERKFIRKLDTKRTSSGRYPPKRQKREEADSQPDKIKSISHSSLLDISLKPPPFYYYTNRSEEPDINPSLPIIPIGNIISLPCRMHVILDIPDFADIVSWQPHGRSFRIHKPEEFEKRILPQFWKKCILKSFLRQLDVWGFLPLTVGQNQRCYYHEYFLRGLPHLCKQMSRSDCKSVPKDNMKKAKRKNEPDLHAISEIYPLPERDQGYNFQMLRTSVLSGPDARMVLSVETGDTKQSSTLNNDTYRDRESVQEDMIQPVESHSNTAIGNTINYSTSQAPLQPQIHLQPLAQQQLQHEEIEAMQNIVQCQQNSMKFQTFLLPLIRMGLGGVATWKWLRNWWSTYYSVPILTVEEEQEELQQLTEQERFRARADIYGSTLQYDVQTAEEEQIALSLLRYKINITPVAEKAELGEAINQCAELVNNRGLMIFLQAENFDAEAARKRIVEYWRVRVNVLGQELAFLPFTINNMFPQEHIQILKMGLIRILPVKDLNGRSILFMEPGRIHGKTYNTEVMARAFLYVFHTALEQRDIGKNGVVLLIDHSTAQPKHANAELAQHLLKIMNSLPLNIKAIHFCGFRNFFDVLAIPIAKFFFRRFLRCRIVQHKEDGEQLLYRFRQFGLPPEKLPTELGGLIALDHERWVEERLTSGM